MSRDVRPAVSRFAVLMERQLRRNDHKGGWLACDLGWLVAKLMEEVGEIAQAAVVTRDASSKRIGEEAADVANLAMMIADRCGALMEKEPAT